MKLSFGFKRTMLVAVAVFVVLIAAELLKGHALRAALIFSALWSAIATCVFTVTRIYYSRKNIACSICNDISE